MSDEILHYHGLDGEKTTVQIVDPDRPGHQHCVNGNMTSIESFTDGHVHTIGDRETTPPIFKGTIEKKGV